MASRDPNDRLQRSGAAPFGGPDGCVEVLGGNELRTQALLLAGLELVLVARPAGGHAGGDLYCLHSCDNRALVKVVFLDITGHGELVACVARAVHRLLHQYAPDTRPARLLYLVNQQFPYFTPGGILATSLSAVYDSRSGELRYAYGGQPGMLLWRAQQRQWRSLAPPRDSMCGLPFGVSEAACYEEGGVSLSSGDILLMFSDGVPEMRSTAGTLLQPEGVLRLAQQCTEEIVANPSVPLPALADAFLKRIQDFHGSSDFSDDTTLLWMRRLPGESL